MSVEKIASKANTFAQISPHDYQLLANKVPNDSKLTFPFDVSTQNGTREIELLSSNPKPFFRSPDNS